MRNFNKIETYKQDIVKLYLEGFSIRAISEKFDLSKSIVGDFIRSKKISRNDFRGSKNPFYGKTHSPEVMEILRVANRGRTPSTKGVSKYLHSRYVNGLLINKWQLEASKRNIDWLISSDEIDTLWENQDGKCALTGKPMKGDFVGNKFHRCSLDRIDSSGDYTVNNCQLILGVVNLAKHVLNNNDFIQLCKDVVTYRDM